MYLGRKFTPPPLHDSIYSICILFNIKGTLSGKTGGESIGRRLDKSQHPGQPKKIKSKPF